jgi:hypothetical protein
MSDSNDSDSFVSSGRSGYSRTPDLKLFRNPEQRRLSDAGRTLDINELEKDSERLARKAKKRLSEGANNPESFVEKLIHWQRKRKMDKIKSLLEILFPKLKSTEEDVRQWCDSVRERKEIYYNHGKALVFDLDHQINTRQHNLDFLDEAINDVNKLGYDIVNEMTELKTAYQFNQVANCRICAVVQLF